MVRGWVYIISNKAMPNLVKVGFSERDPATRAAELAAGTEVPFPFEVVYDVLVYSPYEVEQHAHRCLANLRVRKEWFNCDWLAAVDAVRKAADDLSEILAEKEYEIFTEYKNERARAEREVREREVREREIREQEIREQEIRVREIHARADQQKMMAIQRTEIAVAPRLDTARIAICPRCHSNVKTAGKPPPYFCVQCGSNFAKGI